MDQRSTQVSDRKEKGGWGEKRNEVLEREVLGEKKKEKMFLRRHLVLIMRTSIDK